MLMNIRDEDIAAMIKLMGATAQTSHASALKLIEISKALGAGKQFYVSIPDAGGLYPLQAGTTEVNFFEGYIINPDASKVSMRSGLKMQELTRMRSLMFTTLCDVTMSLDGAGFFDLDAGEKYIISDFDFKEIYISANAPGYVRFVAATTRTSVFRGAGEPTRWNSLLSNTRNNLVWVASGRSPISSRKTVPPAAYSNSPTLS